MAWHIGANIFLKSNFDWCARKLQENKNLNFHSFLEDLTIADFFYETLQKKDSEHCMFII